MREGVGLLAPVLEPHGFRFHLHGSGRSSGGPVAFGDFARGEWRLELHFRFSLGLVKYHCGEVILSHEDYLWSAVGRHGVGEYPGVSDDPLDGFRHLSRDIRAYCSAFLRGDASEFQRLVGVTAARDNELSSMSGFRKLSARSRA